MGAIAAVVAVVLIALAVIGFGVLHGFSSSASPTATPVATATTLSTAAPAALTSIKPGQPVDGIQCNSSEALVYHIHQHLTLYDHGVKRPVPAEIGIPGTEFSSSACFYWIHVHQATPNIIHVESPLKTTFTLGDFLDIWTVTRGTTIPPGNAYVRKLAAAKEGQVTVFLNGKRWRRGYRTVPLQEHNVITVEIGKPVIKPRPFTNWQSL
jgi:hypothetical protein